MCARDLISSFLLHVSSLSIGNNDELRCLISFKQDFSVSVAFNNLIPNDLQLIHLYLYSSLLDHNVYAVYAYI